MKLIPFIVTLFCISLQFAFGQEKPIATYTPKIIYHATPHDDGNGFTSFKSGKGQKASGSYVFFVYKTHILLKHLGRTDFKIDSTTNYSNAINYFLTNPSGIKYEMRFLKYNASIDRITVIKLDSHRHPKEFIILQMADIKY